MTFADLWRPYAWPKEGDRRSKLVDLGIFEDISMVVAISLSGRARSNQIKSNQIKSNHINFISRGYAI